MSRIAAAIFRASFHYKVLRYRCIIPDTAPDVPTTPSYSTFSGAANPMMRSLGHRSKIT
jgi:hypothetical protein